MTRILAAIVRFAEAHHDELAIAILPAIVFLAALVYGSP